MKVGDQKRRYEPASFVLPPWALVRGAEDELQRLVRGAIARRAADWSPRLPPEMRDVALQSVGSAVNDTDWPLLARLLRDEAAAAGGGVWHLSFPRLDGFVYAVGGGDQITTADPGQAAGAGPSSARLPSKTVGERMLEKLSEEGVEPRLDEGGRKVLVMKDAWGDRTFRPLEDFLVADFRVVEGPSPPGEGGSQAGSGKQRMDTTTGKDLPGASGQRFYRLTRFMPRATFLRTWRRAADCEVGASGDIGYGPPDFQYT